MWKKRELMIRYGVMSALRVSSVILSGNPSMYRLVDDVSLSCSIFALNESAGPVFEVRAEGTEE